jgi:hypothetical protein
MSTPQQGTRPMAGKTNMPTETFRDGKQPKAEAVQDAKPDSGEAFRQALGKQGGYGNNNPKKRSENFWGFPDKQ